MSRRWSLKRILLVVLLLATVAAIAHLGGGSLMGHLANHLHGGAGQ